MAPHFHLPLTEACHLPATVSAISIHTLSSSLSLCRGVSQAFPHSLISPLLLIQRDQDYAFNPVQDGCLYLRAHLLAFSPLPLSFPMRFLEGLKEREKDFKKCMTLETKCYSSQRFFTATCAESLSIIHYVTAEHAN